MNYKFTIFDFKNQSSNEISRFLMIKIYTKKGDNGSTGLIGGKRISKSDLKIEAYGTVDELNSYLGLLRDQEVNKTRKAELIEIQNELFVVGSHLAKEKEDINFKLPALDEEGAHKLERAIDRMNEQLPEMKFFVLPGGHQSVSHGHIARCVCRRAERTVVKLSAQEEIDNQIIAYLNRLSDFLFVLCRWMSQELSVEEIKWEPNNNS